MSKLQIIREMDEYFQNTTVHGFSYLQRSNKRLVRRFWAIIILIFFILAAYLINNAFIDWNENQTITTISSIATPVQETQFPTVTVCQNPDTPPDVWSFLEKLFGQIRLEDCKNFIITI